jgi:transcriptional regulator with XRE-family HTH domain
MNQSSLGQRIRYYRKKAGLSQKDLAAAIGMSSNAICHYEQDNREPNILILMKIAKILDVTGDALLGLEHPDLVAKNRKEYALLHAFRGLKSIGQDRTLEYVSALKELPYYANACEHRR